MSSYKNFSKKDRLKKDGSSFNNPNDFDSNNINNIQIKNFQSIKERWRELCSYFRLNKRNIIINK